MKHDKPLYSMTDLAHHLGLPVKTLWHHVRMSQNIPAPTCERGCRSYYTANDVDRIASAFLQAGNRVRFIKEYLAEQE